MSKGAKITLTILGAVVILGTAISLWVYTPGERAGEVDAIRFGTVPTAASTLVYIAEERGFFAENRLQVSTKDYNTGMGTTEALLKGELDIAWVAEFPFVHRTFAEEKISVIAVIGRFNEQVLFGRKDRGIHNVQDLKMKRIGIPRNTISEFYLGRFLELHGMSMRDVTLVDVPPPHSMEAITSGGIDGVIAWEPYSSRIRARLANGATPFPIQSGQPGYGTIACRNEWIKAYPQIVRRFLKALAKAEEYAAGNPDAARKIVRGRLSYDDSFSETIWSENQVALSLDQSLITAMEDEARWMIKNGLTTKEQVPDFLKYICEDVLKSVKSEAVSVIR